MQVERSGLRPTFLARVQGFRRGKEGATAVEFALVAAPFFFAILATMEVAMVMWEGQVLEKAVAQASRRLYTGEFQTDSDNSKLWSSGTENDRKKLQDKLRESICTDMAGFVSCEQIGVDVRPLATYSSTGLASPIVDGKYDTSSYGYNDVGPRQIGLVTASFEYKAFFPPIAIGNLANGNRLIMATAAFTTEPYK